MPNKIWISIPWKASRINLTPMKARINESPLVK
jgi:hypothetical protein